MSKELTDKWLNGTLKKGNYYVNAKNIYNGDLYKGEIDHFNGEAHWFCFAGVEEVLAPVPSYEEYRELLDLNVYEKDRKKVMGLEDKVKRLQEQKQKVIALIKDGRFVEALQELEDETLA